MNAKKVIGFLLMRPAFTQRNLTSIILVAAFFGVYVMMGGKVTTELPKRSQNGGFGQIPGFKPKPKAKQPGQQAQNQAQNQGTAPAPAAPGAKQKKSSLQLLGLQQSGDREARRRAKLGRKLFDDEEREELEKQPIDKEGLIKGVERKNIHMERRLERLENRGKRDTLADIEERLKLRRGP